MSTSEAQKKASKKYLGKLDEFKIRLPKGYKEMIIEHAEKHDKSVNAFFKRAVDETIARDNNKNGTEK